ncbi:MAG: hypothetical protein WD009_14375 [Phycisphaeraceae bacterium]
MKIEYEQRLADLAAFSRYYLDLSGEASMSARIKASIKYPLAIIAMTALISFEAESAAAVTIGLVSAVVLGSWTYRSHPARLRQSTEDTFLQLPPDRLEGLRTIELEADALVERGPEMEIRTRYSAVGPVMSTQRHTFILISPLQAHVIPHDQVDEATRAAFCAALEQRIEASAELVPGAS